MHVKILNLSKKLFDGEVKSITLPTVEGEITILPNHISILTKLCKGAIKIRLENQTEPILFNINSGLCHFASNNATLILD